MTRKRALALALVSLSFTGGPAGAGDFADYSGHQLFERFCASCHGSKGYGDGPVARSLSVLVPDLTRITQRSGGRFPAERIAKVVDGRTGVVAHGTRIMPVWGYEFASTGDDASTAAVVGKLIEHVRSIQQ